MDNIAAATLWRQAVELRDSSRGDDHDKPVVSECFENGSLHIFELVQLDVHADSRIFNVLRIKMKQGFL